MISSVPTIAEAVEQICQGQLEPLELVGRCFDQIRRLDAQLHAWVHLDEQSARDAARRCGERARRGERLGALAGIPCGIKDIVDVQGMVTEAGSPLRKGWVAAEDAPLVARLREAGAIIIGKTVTTQFACFDPPPTLNPWNPKHTPGGSSSGSAVAVATQMCVCAIGTQTGGSIIRPASYCGVAGLKPTYQAVNLEGVLPVSVRLDHAGPLARCVDDLARTFLVVARPTAVADSVADVARRQMIDADLQTPATDVWTMLCQDAAPSPLSILEGPFLDAASAEVRDVTARALQRLEVRSAVTMPETFADVYRHHRCIMAADAAKVHRQSYATDSQAFAPQIASLIAEGQAVSATDYQMACDHQQRFQFEAQEMFDGERLVVLPSTPTVAPARLDTTGDPAFNSPWSYAGFPSVTIPCGLAASGMPCGLQLIGPPHSELRLLQCARWCEERISNGATG